jgi:SAM-dependent methyltransferase
VAGGHIARYATLGELALGFEGLALLRRPVDGPDDQMAERLAEVTRIATRLDRPPFSNGLQVSEFDPRSGYAEAAAVYDTGANPLIEVEHPIVVELAASVAPGRALDAACGTGRHAKHLAERHETFGVDASPEMLEVARGAAPSATFQTSDLEDLPFPDAHFDIAVCALALCHLADLTKAVTEIGRVSKRGAKVILTDPHPMTVAIISHLFVPGPDGTIGFVRNHQRLVGDYLRGFDEAGLRIVRCIEPPTPESALTGGLAAPFVPGAMRQALEGLPQAIIWELEKG